MKKIPHAQNFTRITEPANAQISSWSATFTATSMATIERLFNF